ncbi:MAG: S-layer homology domain-containing protein [Elainellaceae cyanobacterium]
MTNQTPPDPGSSRRDLGLDEIIAILVAFLTIGTIVWWGMTRSGGINLSAIAPFSDTPSQPSDADSEFPLFGDSEEDDAASESMRTGDRPNVSERESPRLRDDQQPDQARTPSLRQEDGQARVQPTPLPGGISEPSPTPTVIPNGTADTEEPVTTPTSPSPSPTATAPPTVSFPDVPETYWARPFITSLAQKEVIQGLPEGGFQPDAAVTRAQFASQIQQAFDRSATESDQSFSDITADYWASDAIRMATQMGFMSGYPDQSFRPDQSITRLEAILSLATGLGLTSADQEVLSVYGDRSQIPDWAAPKIAAATESGLVVNHPDPQMLNPNEPTTRAEAAAMIHQALVSAGNAEPVSSDYIVGP